jgi:hypothetical protein
MLHQRLLAISTPGQQCAINRRAVVGSSRRRNTGEGSSRIAIVASGFPAVVGLPASVRKPNHLPPPISDSVLGR